MRRIISQAEYAKKQKRNRTILGIALLVIMMISVVGYGFMDRGDDDSSTKKVIFNGLEFSNANGFWVAKINNLQFVFSNNPRDVMPIKESVNYADTYSGKPLYISYDDESAAREIYTNFNQIAERIQQACLVNETCEDENLPLKDCTSNFIIIREITGNQTENETETAPVIQNGSCVFIQGKRDNLLNITDGFLLKTLGLS